ncbi:MAG TPA: DUF2470 domain-containing protein [Pilimelia sp.]|nr:DUF2470 domain-containing protein [Pilimelia sp.]
MQPSPAEVARTLVAGRLPGTAHVACRPGPLPVRHATDHAGRLLLLDRANGPLAAALRPAAGAEDVALVLAAADDPPIPGAPAIGRVWVSGWASPLRGAAAREAAIEFAAVHPTGDLLDVGRGVAIYRMAPAEVRLGRASAVIDVDPDEYAAAEPDPLHAVERELLTDLADHHAAEVTAFVRDKLRDAGRDAPAEPAPRLVRLDRYGFVAEVGPAGARYRARLAFPRPVRDHADLSRLLHPAFCRRCRPA